MTSTFGACGDELYLQIYVTIIAILLIVMMAVGGLARFAFDEARFDDMLDDRGRARGHALPPPDAPPARQQEVIESLHGACGSTSRSMRATARCSPPRGVRCRRSSSTPRIRCGCAAAAAPGCCRLSDGRFLVTGALRGPWRPGRWVLIALFVDRGRGRDRRLAADAPAHAPAGAAARPASTSSAKAIWRRA